jgi:hypothetical protein
MSYANKDVVKNYNNWIVLNGNHQITDKIGIHTEIQNRKNGIQFSKQQELYRFGLEYYTTHFTYTVGYAFVSTHPYGNQPVPIGFNENRIWQQLIFNQKLGESTIRHRVRLEQRFIEHIQYNQLDKNYFIDGNNYQDRLRYNLLFVLPIYKIDTQNEIKELFFTFNEEIFIFHKNLKSLFFDQNRTNLSLGFKFNKSTSVQLGYLNQFLIKGNRTQAEQNHTLSFGITHNLKYVK